MLRRSALCAAAALAGAAGLGLEVLAIGSAGLLLGQGRAGAFGVAAFVAGWALGAFLAGRHRGAPGRALLVAGGGVLVAAAAAPPFFLTLGPGLAGGSEPLAALLGTAVLLALAVPQGALLPLLVRAWPGDRGLAPLWAANLFGSVAGAGGIGHALVGAVGVPRAALAAGGLALVAAALAALAARRDGAPSETGDEPAPVAPLPGAGWPPAAAGLALGLGTAWMVTVEWLAVRLGVLWLGGMQAAVAAVLAAALLALAAGATLLPALLPRDERGPAAVLGLAALGSGWLLFAAPLLARLEDAPPLVLALALTGPALLPFGALLPALDRGLAGEGGRRVGGLLLHEAWGAPLGALLAHGLLVPRFGLGGAAGLACFFGAAALALPAWVARRVPGAPGPASGRSRARVPLGAAALVALLGLGYLAAPEPALAAPPLANPALEIRSFEEDADFAVAVVDDGLIGERTLLTDGFRAAGTGRAYRYMRVLGHLPLLLHPAPRRVAVLALGTGTTLGAVSLHPEVERIDVLELSAAVVRQADWFEEVDRGALGDPRVRVRLGDGRRTLASLAGGGGELDVLTLEPLLPDSPFGVHLYTTGFYADARAALAPGGIVCQWVPPHALEPATFDAVLDAFGRSFPWSSVWQFGTQAILIGAESAPTLLVARFPDADSAAEAELAAELRDLGIDTPGGLLARWIGRLWDDEDVALLGVERPLTDADPWILYRPRREGAELLADLPDNLGCLLSLQEPVPAAVFAGLEDRERMFGEGVASLRRARFMHARGEAGDGMGSVLVEVQSRLMHALVLAPGDPAVMEFAEETRFLLALRLGVAMLADGRPEEGLEHLVTAAELRPERGDVHLYLATALQRSDTVPGAREAFAAALERCPRILETPAGERALRLGLVPATLR